MLNGKDWEESDCGPVSARSWRKWIPREFSSSAAGSCPRVELCTPQTQVEYAYGWRTIIVHDASEGEWEKAVSAYFKTITRHFTEGTGENDGKRQASRSPDRGSNQTRPEYEIPFHLCGAYGFKIKLCNWTGLWSAWRTDVQVWNSMGTLTLMCNAPCSPFHFIAGTRLPRWPVHR